EDNAADLALIRVYGAPDLVPASFAGDAAKSPDLMLIGIADPQSQGGGGAVSSTPAKLKGEAIEPSPQLGFSGAAALDAQGHLAGRVVLKPAVVATVGAASAPPHATLVPVPAVRAFLDGQKLASPPARAGVDAAKASVVRVICVRK